MKILVTGGAGFIGSNLCRKLLEQGHHVICMDNLYTGKYKNIEELTKKVNFDFINYDICSPFHITNLDQIYNLACPASPPAYQGEHAIETTKACTVGVIRLLDLAKETNAKFLQASTSEIYGEPLEHPQKEEYRGNVNPIGIRACYDEGKRCAESLVMDYHRIYGIDTKIVRIFNTYGPYMDKDDGRVVTNFIKQALKNEDITIYGNGYQTRSFCYIDDLVEGLIAVMNGNYNEPVNLGNPNEFTIRELAELVIEKIKPKCSLNWCNLPMDDPTRRKPCIDKAIKLFNWQPTIQLSEGLDKTIEYLKGEI